MAASIATVKILLNSVVSTDETVFTTADIKIFFYGSLLPESKYMELHLKIIPIEIITQYNLMDIQANGWVYINF